MSAVQVLYWSVSTNMVFGVISLSLVVYSLIFIRPINILGMIVPLAVSVPLLAWFIVVYFMFSTQQIDQQQLSLYIRPPLAVFELVPGLFAFSQILWTHHRNEGNNHAS